MSLEEKKFKVLTGEDINVSYLAKVFEIDKEVYEPKYVGCLENMEKRYKAEKRSFVCIEDEGSGELAGYINFFPVNDELWEDIVETGAVIRDDDIEPGELKPFEKKFTDKDVEEGKGYNLFIISVVIREKYRKYKEAVITLTRGFREYLCKLDDKGYKIHALAGTAVSDDGMKFMRERYFYLKREVGDLEDNGVKAEEPDRVFICDGDGLEKFLDIRRKDCFRYKKTYMNDLYMIVPFSCNENGLKGFWCDEEEEAKALCVLPEGDQPDEVMTARLLSCLNEDLVYECTPEMTENIRHYYLGSCNFLFSYDEYPALGEEDEGRTYFYGEEKAHLIMMADKVNKLFNLLIFIPDNKFCPSTAQDQMSQSFLPVRKISGGLIDEGKVPYKYVHNRNKDGNPNGTAPDSIASDIQYFDLYQLVNHLYGLIPCGHGKTLVCASKKPDDTELGCMLAGETYMSIHQDFKIRSSVFNLEEQSRKVVYDYYDIYLSERAVVFVEKPREDVPSLFEPRIKEGEKEEDPEVRNYRIEGRIELVTTYTFIMEVVTFRNTALQKMSEKVSAAILQDGDVSYTYLQTLYRDFAGTDKYANKRNFKYYGTQKEAEAILDAFKTSELESDYHDKQGFLESYIDLSSANRSKLTTTIVGLAATLMSLFGLKEIFSEVIQPFAEKHGVPLTGDAAFFYQLVIAVFLFYLLITVTLYFRDRKRREENLIETYKRKYYFLDDEEDGEEGERS